MSGATSGARTSPKVSVCVITYNQEALIGPCLQSIIDQVTDFDFEVIVGEDASTDGTRRVVEEFARRYPDRIRPIYQERNIGRGAHNFRTVHLAARGEYVAHIDGDDLALPGKLQAQADVLDARPEVAFAAHAVRVIGSEEVLGHDPRYPELGTAYDLLRFGTYFVHSSVMYRRTTGGVEAFPERAIDYYMHLGRAVHGAIYLDRRLWGCYRRHAAGLSQHADNRPGNERLYEEAFDHALALGLDPRRVEAARLARRMKFAIARRLGGDTAGYRETVRLRPGDWALACSKHRLLSLTRWAPQVVDVYFWLQRWRARVTGAGAS